MTRHPLLPCPKCMNSLAERGLVFPDGRIVERETAAKLRGVPPPAPIGVQYECIHCGSLHTLATAAAPRVA